MLKKAFLAVFILFIAAIVFVDNYYFYSGPDLDVDSCSASSQFDLSQFASEIAPFIEKFHDPAKEYNNQDIRGYFSIKPNQSTNLYGACDLAYILWITGELKDRTTVRGRAEWATLIQSFQDPETGLFSKNIVDGESVTHATAFATAALKLLNYKPRFPHYWAEKTFQSEKSVNHWLDSFYWDQIWTGSHEIGQVAAIIDAPNGLSLDRDFQFWILDAMDKRIDKTTGFWKNGILDKVISDVTTIDLGGAAHFWWIYNHLGEQIPFPEKVIQGILSLQQDSGIWGNRLFNGPFPQGIDFDAVNGYKIAYNDLPEELQKKYKDEIVRSLEIYGCAVSRFLNHPGAIDKYFTSVHKLVGTLNAIAETNQLYRKLTKRDLFILPKKWQPTLDVVAWQ